MAKEYTTPDVAGAPRSRALLVLAACAIAAVLAGCADDDDEDASHDDTSAPTAASTKPEATDRPEAARRTASRFIEAARNSRVQEVCALVSSQSSLGRRGEPACADGLRPVADVFGAQIEDEVHGDPKFADVKVTGSRARVTFVDRRTDPLLLRVEGGEWRVVLP